MALNSLGTIPNHGGHLNWAEATFPAAPQPWIDLSTGINPISFPATAVSAAAWQALPDQGQMDRLREAASIAFGRLGGGMVAAPGTQALIQLLPQLVSEPKTIRVLVQKPTYNEHARCWRRAGAEVKEAEDPIAGLQDAEVIVIGRPNNPDGKLHDAAMALEAAANLAKRGGLLVVDEAFCDLMPEQSLAKAAGTPGLLILRSFGKFYGLAGLRLGFALGHESMTSRLSEALGPWAVSGPALDIGAEAYEDEGWAKDMRATLKAAAASLDQVLNAGGLAVLGGTDLFRYVACEQALALFRHLGQNGILVRSFPDQPGRLRFGLPPDETGLRRLETALASFRPADVAVGG
ncbi:MAG: threonine-phosphate decarboxylase CobD [Magnetovibrionaceae bacterium]